MAYDLSFPEHLDSNDGAEKICECLRKYFGTNKKYNVVRYVLNDEYEIWFATLAYLKDGEYKTHSAEGWINVFDQNEEVIYQRNPDVKRMEGMAADPDRKYLLFAKEEGEQYWWFKGVYECVGRDEEHGFIHHRTSKEYGRDDVSRYINWNSLDERIKQFIELILQKQSGKDYGTTEIGFNVGFCKEQEGYKHKLWQDARARLNATEWVKEDIGSGKIFSCIKEALTTKTDKEQENLVDWHDVENFGVTFAKDIGAVEAAVFKFFHTTDEKEAFVEMTTAIGERYPLISYLMFLKDSDRFLPFRPMALKERFEILDIRYPIVDVRSWDEYMRYIEIVRLIRSRLADKVGVDTDLLDAHSFIWMSNMLEGVGISEESEELIDEPENESAVIITGKEGRRISIYTTKYERDPRLRAEAIRIHGKSCMACGVNLKRVYGHLGEGCIEVHHLKPLHTREESVEVNPEKDMVCLCPNCHRIIHRKKNYIMTLEELKSLIKNPSCEKE